ncbi:MAG: tetratricopeptide repeat protein, partial [Syntrophorhabdales bacterium]
MKHILTVVFVVFLTYSPALAAKGSGSAFFYFLEGYRSSQAGRYDEALQYYKSALSRDPGSEQIKNEMALLYVKKGELDHAETLLKESVQGEPKNRHSLMLLAGIYASKDE